MSIDVGAVMDELAVRLRTIDGLRVYEYPADTVAVPSAVVAYPTTFEYDVAYGRAADMAVFPVYIVLSKVVDRTSRDALTAYMAGSGPRSVKTAIEADTTLAGAAKTIRVRSSPPVSTISVAGVDYVGATFEVEVYA